MLLAPVLDRIEKDFARTVNELMEFCAQPSISAQNFGVQEMASLVENSFRELNATVTLHPCEGGSPVVFANFSGRTRHRLLFYNHYDVQPPDPIEEWASPPFEPAVRDGTVFGRGTADNKGALVARLAAIRAFLEVYGELPVSIGFLVEGEEESGSPHLQAFVDANRQDLVGDGLIWEGSSADQSGTPVVRLGNKGMLYVELRARGPNSDAHSRFAGVFPHPIWKLVWALSLVRRPDGAIVLPGFHDHVKPPTPAEDSFYAMLASNAEGLLRQYGLDTSFPPRSPKDIMVELYGAPTANIAGISGGYEGAGMKTILPAVACAKLEFRLVPDQDPDDILEALRTYLAEHGLGDIEIVPLSKGYPSKTHIDHPFVNLVRETGARTYGRPLTIEPISSGSGPRYVFTSWSNIPIVAIGPSHAGSKIHEPNENIRLDHFLGHIKHVAAIMHALAFGLNDSK